MHNQLITIRYVTKFGCNQKAEFTFCKASKQRPSSNPSPPVITTIIDAFNIIEQLSILRTRQLILLSLSLMEPINPNKNHD